VQRGANGAVNAVCHAALGACVNPEAEPDVDLPVKTKVPPSPPLPGGGSSPSASYANFVDGADLGSAEACKKNERLGVVGSAGAVLLLAVVLRRLEVVVLAVDLGLWMGLLP
jgi:hypothetical protein